MKVWVTLGWYRLILSPSGMSELGSMESFALYEKQWDLCYVCMSKGQTKHLHINGRRMLLLPGYKNHETIFLYQFCQKKKSSCKQKCPAKIKMQILWFLLFLFKFEIVLFFLLRSLMFSPPTRSALWLQKKVVDQTHELMTCRSRTRGPVRSDALLELWTSEVWMFWLLL